LKSGAVAVLRSLGGCLAAGLVVGIAVAGLGSRLVMRLLAVADPAARGIITENGNVVGDITFGGTAGLVVFIGIPSGILAGLIVYLVRRWLPARLVWRGLALSVVLLALLGRTVIDPENVDFLFLDPADLAVTLFGVLFFVAGFALVPLADRWGPGVPRLFYRQDVTVVGGIAITIAVVLGLLELGRDIAELV
jgi:hypothetical protein